VVSNRKRDLPDLSAALLPESAQPIKSNFIAKTLVGVSQLSDNRYTRTALVEADSPSEMPVEAPVDVYAFTGT
jgi:hypothetical protein